MKRLSLIFVAFTLAASLLVGAASAQSVPTIRVAIDADPSGNTATSLGPLNACVRTEPGQQVVVDFVVDDVPGPPETNGMISFQIDIDYTPDILEVSGVDYGFLLGASGTFEPLEFQVDSTPDRDGRFRVGVVDTAVNAGAQGANVEEGPGVLARFTLTARAQGVANVVPAVDPSENDPNVFDAYPAVYGNENRPYMVKSVAGAIVAVGQDCPVPPDSTPVPREVPPIDETLVAGGPTPQASPGGATGGSTPGPTGTTEPTGTPTAAPTISGGEASTPDESDGGTGAGTIALVAGLALAGVGLTVGGGRMLLSKRGRRNIGPE